MQLKLFSLKDRKETTLIDAFGGGFLTDALVSYWFFRRFGIAESTLALLFFTVHVLNAPSPAATASLAIGRMVAERALARLG